MIEFETARAKRESGRVAKAIARVREKARGTLPEDDDPDSRKVRCSGAGKQGSSIITSPELVVPVGSKKQLLISLATSLWELGRLDSREIPQVRGRELDPDDEEHGTPLQRALMRSTIPELTTAVRKELQEGEEVVVEGPLKPPARESLKKLGLRVCEELGEEEKRYLDMTPFIFVLAGLMMALRYIALGMDSQVMYIFAGVAFALLITLRPFLGKLMRPADS